MRKALVLRSIAYYYGKTSFVHGRASRNVFNSSQHSYSLVGEQHSSIKKLPVVARTCYSSSETEKSNSRCYRKQNILFMGTDDFAVSVLNDLNIDRTTNTDSPIAHIEVVCPPDRLFGRKKVLKPAATKVYARENDLSVNEIPVEGIKHWTVPTVSPLFAQTQDSLVDKATKFDIAVVVSFGYFIPGKVIDSFDLCVNIHPSLLPRHRGASPIQYTILSGDNEAGVSLIELSKKSFDSGNIVQQTSIRVEKSDTFQSLSKKITPLSSQMLLSTLSSVASGQPILSRPQSEMERETTLAPKIDITTTAVEWSLNSRAHIDRMYRAFSEKTQLHSIWEGKHIKLLDMVESTTETSIDNHPAGTPRYDNVAKTLFIKCIDGWVGFKSLQLATKKPMSSAAFANGFGLKPTGFSPTGARFGSLQSQPEAKRTGAKHV
eukprot:CFRG4898T1